MAGIMHVNMVDSEKEIFSGEAEYLVAPAFNGEIGIFPHHIQLICKLKLGVLRIKFPNQAMQVVYAISGGFMEVNRNHVTILADIVERTDELDEARLIQQKEDALKRINESGSSMSSDFAKAQASLELAVAQLKALDFIKRYSNRA